MTEELRKLSEKSVAPIKEMARAMGLLTSEEDAQDRVYLTRLANDPRHPMTEEMADAVMGKPAPERRLMLIKWANEGMMPLDDTMAQWAGAMTGQPESGSSPEPSSSESSTSPTAWQMGPGRVVAAEPVNANDLPSSEVRSGALTGVGSTSSSFSVEAYLRLPLEAKRDAFVHDGFLYVRRGTLRGWMSKLMAGRCCHPQREGQAHHSSDCWVYVDGKS